MPVPPVSEGFADRALTRAWDAAHGQSRRSRSPMRYGLVGLAAGVVMAVVLVAQFTGPREVVETPPTIEVVQVEPHSIRPVQVRLVSREALPDATITIHLEGDVALAGYPGSSTLSWQTSIAAGSNQMSLPVQLRGEENAAITIEVRSGNARKQMQVSVQPALQANAQVQREYLPSSGSQIAI